MTGGAAIRFSVLAFALSGFAVSAGQADAIQFHQPSVTAAPATLFDLDAHALAGQIEQALVEHTGFARLRAFKVHWDRPSFRCLVRNHELYETRHGVCLVEISAFQVAATALLIRGDSKDVLDVSILDAVIE